MGMTVKALFLGGPLDGHWQDVDVAQPEVMAPEFHPQVFDLCSPDLGASAMTIRRYRRKVFRRVSGGPYGKVQDVYLYQCETDPRTDDELSELLRMVLGW